MFEAQEDDDCYSRLWGFPLGVLSSLCDGHGHGLFILATCVTVMVTVTVTGYLF